MLNFVFRRANPAFKLKSLSSTFTLTKNTQAFNMPMPAARFSSKELPLRQGL